MNIDGDPGDEHVDAIGRLKSSITLLLWQFELEGCKPESNVAWFDAYRYHDAMRSCCAACADEVDSEDGA